MKDKKFKSWIGKEIPRRNKLSKDKDKMVKIELKGNRINKKEDKNMIEAHKRRLRISSNIQMSDGSFGISLNLGEHLPTGCNEVLVYVVKEGKICHKRVCLPHQVYLEELMKQTENMKYPMYFEPHFPKYPSISIMEEKEV